jgi:DNA-binding LytR/AlgR family response regulator
MKVSMEEIDPSQEEEVIIRCHEISDEFLRLVRKIKMCGETLIGYDGGDIHRIPLRDVYYFEAVDSKTFLYCKGKVFESKQKLYELEQMSEGGSFFRSSKSTVLNVSKISYVSPSVSGRMEAKLDNGETVVISRQYVPALKKMLDL